MSNIDMNFIYSGQAETYSCDLELFHKLGLKTFKTESQEKIFVGEYKLPHYDKANIKIHVTCKPAQFWQFEVETDGNKKFNIRTGSGSLSDYWESVIKVAEGCFVMNQINEDWTNDKICNWLKDVDMLWNEGNQDEESEGRKQLRHLINELSK